MTRKAPPRPSGPSTTNGGRFRKGHSGNPKGRPRKDAPAVSAFDIVVNRTLVVTRNGVPREITMEEALQHRTYQQAVSGKRMAVREVLKWIERREAWLAKHAPAPTRPAITLRHSIDPDNADAALQLLGIAVENTERKAWNLDREPLLLDTWAVQAAVDRRRSLRLTESDLQSIRRCTRDDHLLRLPRGVVDHG